MTGPLRRSRQSPALRHNKGGRDRSGDSIRTGFGPILSVAETSKRLPVIAPSVYRAQSTGDRRSSAGRTFSNMPLSALRRTVPPSVDTQPVAARCWRPAPRGAAACSRGERTTEAVYRWLLAD
jgi:hypothetical protein